MRRPVMTLACAVAMLVPSGPALGSSAGDIGGESLGLPAVQGRIARVGRPSPGDVVLLLWPSQESLEATPQGSLITPFPVSTSATDGRGRFELRLDPTSIPAEYKSGEGVINTEVIASNGKQQMSWNMSLRYLKARMEVLGTSPTHELAPMAP